MTMHLIENDQSNACPVAREYGSIRAFFNRIVREVWHYRLRRWLPRLVWIGDEIDVQITFSEDKIDPDGPLRPLFSGGLFEVEKQLRNMGICFDTGCGAGGRDWEWDWSLKGPVRVKFRSRARNPEKRTRKERPQPKLVA